MLSIDDNNFDIFLGVQFEILQDISFTIYFQVSGVSGIAIDFTLEYMVVREQDIRHDMFRWQQS